MDAVAAASRALAQALGQAAARGPGALVGLEHEFFVRDANGLRMDFRSLIHDLGFSGRHLDPSDPNAYRLASGSIITCDDGEAEIAIPPVAATTRFAGRVVDAAEHARADLQRSLPRGYRLEGCSTHLSVSLPDSLLEACARRYTVTFAPALMLLMDRSHSPGLLVRPRPGRLELGGEFVAGASLHAAVTFAAGSVRALAAAAGGSRAPLPPGLEGRIKPANTRYGWYIDRRAFGVDLYESGRATPLPLAGGGWTTAQEQLRLGWSIARAELVSSGVASHHDLALTDDIAAGHLPIPLEGGRIPARGTRPRASLGESPFGSALRVRVRPGFGVAPVMLTWAVAVFLLANPGRSRRAFASIPGERLRVFLELLDAGSLDGAMAEYLSRRPGGRRLERPHQATEAGLYDELGPRLGLLPPEPGFAVSPAVSMVSRGRDWHPRSLARWVRRMRRAAWPAVREAGRLSDA